MSGANMKHVMSSMLKQQAALGGKTSKPMLEFVRKGKKNTAGDLNMHGLVHSSMDISKEMYEYM